MTVSWLYLRDFLAYCAELVQTLSAAIMNGNASIMVVEDETAVRDMLKLSLGRGGYQVVEASTAAQARGLLASERPDLILLDWMLPDVSGLELARTLKRDARTRGLPIILLTARGEEEDKVRGLDAGADDYITKPFSPRELMARIKAVLRRGQGEGQEATIEIGGLCLDAAAHRVTAQGRAVVLGPTEFRLLRFFMTHPERVYSRAQLLDQVWGTQVFIEERTVDVHIRRLRKVLEEHGQERLVQTVRGAGYRFSKRA
jgi:two-component system phosphate regulon response regulator PhoB